MKRKPSPMRFNQAKIEKAYAFFSRMEAKGQPFTPHDIEQATGYTTKVVSGYLTKKWEWFLQKDGNHYYCKGLHRHPKPYFFNIHSQKYQDPHSHSLPTETSRIITSLFLLMIITGWYRLSRKVRFKIWHIYIPLLFFHHICQII